MRKLKFILTVLIFIHSDISFSNVDDGWRTEKLKSYSYFYTSNDSSNTIEYMKLIDEGIKSVEMFFGSPYSKRFNIYVHPTRHSLDSTWQKDWSMPEFNSECWMVASGIATKLDVISPKEWDKLSCEHKYSDIIHTRQLITHELFHVYHGQVNISPDFGNTEGIDWFVEGLATYASGQCDSSRIADVKVAIRENTIPTSLDGFWTGKIKYGLSGSVVKFIDEKYGREKLSELLPLNKKTDILKVLKVDEIQLLANWQQYVLQL